MPAKKLAKPPAKPAKSTVKSAVKSAAKLTTKSTVKATAKKAKGCTPISVQVAFLTPDDKTEIHFGLTKGCNPDDSVFWLIDFILKELKGGEMKTRIEVHVKVGKEQEQDAETLSKVKKLNPENTDLLKTKVTKRAKQLTPGTESDPKLNNLLLATLQN